MYKYKCGLRAFAAKRVVMGGTRVIPGTHQHGQLGTTNLSSPPTSSTLPNLSCPQTPSLIAPLPYCVKKQGNSSFRRARIYKAAATGALLCFVFLSPFPFISRALLIERAARSLWE